MAEDELKKSDRGADDSMSASGDGIGSGVGMSGNSIENSTSVSGNGPVGAGEGLEGASGAKVGYEEGFGEKAQDEALEGAEKTKRAGKVSKKAYVGVIVALVAVILVAVGITVAVIWGSKELVTEVVESEKPIVRDEIEELSLDDEVVQRLYGQFDVIRDTFNASFYRGELYTGPVLTDEEKAYAQDVKRQGRLSIAYLNSTGKTCRATVDNGGLIRRYGDFIFNWSDEQIKNNRCVDGEEVRQNFEKIFGEKIELVGCDNFLDDECGKRDSIFTSTYSPSYDEFYNTLGGAGSPGYYKRRLIKVEKDAERVYLYEQAMIYACGPDEENDEASLCEIYDVFRDEDSAEMTKIEVLDAELNEYLESDGLFGDIEKINAGRWTFRKNEEGNYIFEGLEKVN